MNIKSERLKKLEAELEDLLQWKNLGLVPKKDTVKHEEEIKAIKNRIDEEKERLKFLKENGEMEEYLPPKKSASKQSYSEPQTLPEITMGIDNMTEFGFEEESYETETGSEETQFDEEATIAENEEDDEDPFSDKNRWKRGILEDPDADNW